MTTFFYVIVVLWLFVDLDQVGNFQLFNEHIVVHHLCSVFEICQQAGLLFSYNDYVVINEYGHFTLYFYFVFTSKAPTLNECIDVMKCKGHFCTHTQIKDPSWFTYQLVYS